VIALSLFVYAFYEFLELAEDTYLAILGTANAVLISAIAVSRRVMGIVAVGRVPTDLTARVPCPKGPASRMRNELRSQMSALRPAFHRNRRLRRKAAGLRLQSLASTYDA
jgi:hypothetical protein